VKTWQGSFHFCPSGFSGLLANLVAELVRQDILDRVLNQGFRLSLCLGFDSATKCAQLCASFTRSLSFWNTGWRPFGVILIRCLAFALVCLCSASRSMRSCWHRLLRANNRWSTLRQYRWGGSGYNLAENSRASSRLASFAHSGIMSV